MPELPEVETVRQGLLKLVQSKKIAKVTVLWPRIVTNDLTEFDQRLSGQTIETIDRRGKYLLFRLSNHLTLVSHLRMEGKYHLEAAGVPPEKHTHVIFEFTDGQQLFYNDVRKFGRMTLGDTGFEKQLSGIQALGPEPLSPEFTIPAFKAALKRRHKNIKSALLDQHSVAGLGNIYVDEVLWLSKIHPLQPANSLTDAEISALFSAIREEMKIAIEAGGTTIRSYVDAAGHQGHFQLQLHVYGHQGDPCERCGTTIEKFKVGGRGTHICPKEQQLR
ncbi:DNA-formamidopyrimidine glycosylase [Agrilactobacillus yilanensis]|uniref:Formamidopyrimidine-DNA glycosylase n=1 Tax=Agrilactobacillus yilanensis TaxID=2485997 RepID=A0ABW4J8P4_9LACO|nr:DNA-formamidopyrimidine glycosylase [Agrilactobacillus yilanensis]